MMKSEILILLTDGYADWEPAYVCSELNTFDSDYSVKTIAAKNSIVSMGGFHIIPDYSVSNCPEKYDMLIIPGGTGWSDNDNSAVLPIVKAAVERRIPIAAICDATNFLAENGFLDKVKHTGNTLAYMKMRAPHYKGDENYVECQSVSDCGIVTANGSAVLEFTRDILTLLEAKPRKMISEWYKIHKVGYYQE